MNEHLATPDDYEALWDKYGIETTLYADGRQDATRDNAGWFATGGRRARPLPLMADREANEAYAHRWGYYWMRCHRCGEFKGGHETERNRICERFYLEKVQESIQRYEVPIRAAAYAIMHGQHSISRLEELARPDHFRRPLFGRRTCPCGSEKDHNNLVENLVFNGLWRM